MSTRNIQNWLKCIFNPNFWLDVFIYGWKIENRTIQETQYLFFSAYFQRNILKISVLTWPRLSVDPCISMQQIEKRWTDFHEILYLRVLAKCVNVFHRRLRSQHAKYTTKMLFCAHLTQKPREVAKYLSERKML
jgi:hypothetical protein